MANFKKELKSKTKQNHFRLDDTSLTATVVVLPAFPVYTCFGIGEITESGSGSETPSG